MDPPTIREIHNANSPDDRAKYHAPDGTNDNSLPNAIGKIRYAHQVWFQNGNPIVGYSKLKGCIRLMFWSGTDIEEPVLKHGSGKSTGTAIH